MNRKGLVIALAALLALAWAAGCGEDEVFRAAGESGGFDAGPGADGGATSAPGTGGDAGGAGCGSSAGAPPRVLLSMNNTSTSELAVFNLTTHAVDGRLTYPGFIGTTWSPGTDPYLLEQEADLVARLDPRAPWKVVSSWSVAGTDRPDGGSTFAEPTAIVVPSCGKGYVVRANRNALAVVDTTHAGDAGAPTSFLDLAGQLQASDHDGIVEPTSALYVPSKRRVYVLVGNFDHTTVATDGYTNLCTPAKPAIVAIDVDTDQIVSLGGSGPGGSIQLEGYNPPFGAPLWYDAALDRLLVLEAGCNLNDGDGGAGAIARRRIEEVQLATGQVRTLLGLEDKDFPNGLLFVDGARAVVALVDGAFMPHAFFWNPQETHLGAEIPGGLSFVSYDGKGSVVGARPQTVDGGPGVAILAVPFTDAGTVDAASMTTLGTNPFTDNTGFLGGAEVWPRP